MIEYKEEDNIIMLILYVIYVIFMIQRKNIYKKFVFFFSILLTYCMNKN